MNAWNWSRLPKGDGPAGDFASADHGHFDAAAHSLTGYDAARLPCCTTVAQSSDPP
jgi:hypothetical protein